MTFTKWLKALPGNLPFSPLCLHLWGDLAPRHVAGTSPDLKITSFNTLRRPGSRPGSDLMLTFNAWASLWFPDPTLACVSVWITGFLACFLGLSFCVTSEVLETALSPLSSDVSMSFRASRLTCKEDRLSPRGAALPGSPLSLSGSLCLHLYTGSLPCSVI